MFVSEMTRAVPMPKARCICNRGAPTLHNRTDSSSTMHDLTQHFVGL